MGSRVGFNSWFETLIGVIRLFIAIIIPRVRFLSLLDWYWTVINDGIEAADFTSNPIELIPWIISTADWNQIVVDWIKGCQWGRISLDCNMKIICNSIGEQLGELQIRY